MDIPIDKIKGNRGIPSHPAERMSGNAVFTGQSAQTSIHRLTHGRKRQNPENRPLMGLRGS